MEEKEMLLKTIEALNTTVSSLSATNASLQRRVDELTAQVAWLNRQLFGRKSEKLSPLGLSRKRRRTGNVSGRTAR